VDVAPVGETSADHLVRGDVVRLEGVERLVGKDHAEAEGVVRAVPLVDRDVPARPGFLRKQREVEAARPAADHRDLHEITAVASISRSASGSTRPEPCTTAIAG